MAFEIPLEADRIDDLNLFSAFLRAPVIGTLLWILGGDKAKDEDSKKRLDDKDDEGNDPVDTNSMKRTLSKHQRCTLKKTAPSLIGSEISESEVRESLDAMCLYSENSSKCIPGIKKKSLSWSDEVGDDLVVYSEVRAMYEPKPPHEQPVRSALSRSRSIRADANCLGKSQIENKYLPPQNSHRPMNSLHKHQTMSSAYTMNHVEPYSSGTGGYDSPQWGWYINTTPPSPDMYFTSRPNKALKRSGGPAAESSGDSASTVAIAPSSAPNPVWCSLHDKHKAAPMGWPSVPL